MTLNVFIKKATTKDGKEFKTASYVSPKNVWYKVKFTQDSGISLAKTNVGLYDLEVNAEKINIQRNPINLENGETYIEKIVWVADDKAKLTKHTETEEEKKERIDKVLNELAGVEE